MAVSFQTSFAGLPVSWNQGYLYDQFGIGPSPWAPATNFNRITGAGNQLPTYIGAPPPPSQAYLGQAGMAGQALQNLAAQINPFAFGQAGAGNIQQMQALAGQLRNQFNFNIPYAKQALREAFDPQKAAYNQFMADLLEQERAGQALRGVSMTPYGAAVEANAVNRFINEWRTQQINRMLTGSQAASTLEQPVLASRQAAGELYGRASDAIRQNVMAQLQAFGLKGDMLAKAAQHILGILESLKISTSKSGSIS